MADKDKVILKKPAQPGVDMSITDFTFVSSVKVNWTKVTKLMYKNKYLTFIGTKDQLDVLDVIQVGNLSLKYRVVKLEKMTDREGYIYRIRRIDGGSTTSTDLDAIKVGQKVSIVNRKTFDQMINYAESMREPAEETCECVEEESCKICADKPFIPSASTSYISPEYNQYNLTIPGLTYSTFELKYLLDTGVYETQILDNQDKEPIQVIFCATYGTITFDGVLKFGENESCPSVNPCIINPDLSSTGPC